MEIKEIIIFYCELGKYSHGVDVLEYTEANLKFAQSQFERCKNCYLVKMRVEYIEDDEIYEEILFKRNICF
jgi:hypothetical protein